MKHYKIDVGDRFGRLEVIGFVTKRGGKVTCRCSCGVAKVTLRTSLVIGDVTSCGCYQREVAAATKHRHGNSVHGRESRAYKSWKSMKERCGNINGRAYPYYGGRGITVCDRWRESFEVFHADMGDPPEGTSIDRIDNNRGYEPGNCRWATPKTQGNNKRNNHSVTHNGVTLNLTQWSEKLGIRQSTLWMRWRRSDGNAAATLRPLKKSAVAQDYHDERGG